MSAGPRTGATASTPTWRPFRVAVTVVAREIRAIPGSRRRPASSGPVTTAPGPDPWLANDTWNGTPYSAGEDSRWARLPPNTAVAHSAATASTVPSRAVPTGAGGP